MKDGHNNHHTSWQRREWSQSGITRRIREHPGMIIRLPIKLHNELHSEIPAVRPPHLVLGRVMLAGLRTDDTDPYSVIPKLTDFLWQLANADSRLGHEAYRMANHYETQMEFLGVRNGTPTDQQF